MTRRPATSAEMRALRATVARLRAGIMALVFGFAGGTLIAVATLWLVVRGGEEVGPHLGLLANYFPGYRVTWLGSLLGFVYGAVVGAVFGWTLARIYNAIAAMRSDD